MDNAIVNTIPPIYIIAKPIGIPITPTITLFNNSLNGSISLVINSQKYNKFEKDDKKNINSK